MPLYTGCRERCPECPNTAAVIPGEGPRDAKVFFISDVPGKVENEQGRVLSSKAGKEFRNTYLRLAGLHPTDVYITYAVKCFLSNSGKEPGESLVNSCVDFHLRRELEIVRPDYIVTLGAMAGRAIKAPGSLDLQASIPFRHTIHGKPYKVFPTYSPAMGLYKTGFMLHLSESFKTLGSVLDGTHTRVQDPGKGRITYGEITDGKQVNEVLRNGVNIAIDTETVGGIHDAPWCLTFSQNEYSGYLIRAANKRAVQEFNCRMNVLAPKVYIHNSLFDLNVLDQMGVTVSNPMQRLVDTMHGAYHLAKFPFIGLKSLSYRHLGIRMDDFDDVVTPYWGPLALEYIERVNRTDWGKPPKVWVEDKVKGLHKKQPQSLNAKIKRLIHDYVKSDDWDSEILERWFDWQDELDAGTEAKILAKYGPIPVKSITHVPFEKALKYACTDARSTWILGEQFLPEQREKL